MDDLRLIVGMLKGHMDAQLESNRINRIEHQQMMDKISKINEWRWTLEGKRMILSSVLGMFGGAMASFIFKKLLQV